VFYFFEVKCQHGGPGPGSMQCAFHTAFPFLFIICAHAGFSSPIIPLGNNCKQSHHGHSVAAKQISVVNHEPSIMLMEVFDKEEPPFQLCERDFPSYFINRKHPQDYQLLDDPIDPECIYHVDGPHRRLFLRVSFKCKAGFIPVTFLLDTCFPLWFRLSGEAADVLQLHSVVMSDDYWGWYFINDNLGADYQCQPERKREMIICDKTDTEYEPVNFIGLAALSKLGLNLYDSSFEINKKIRWF
jgi:hypothetical protein